MKLVLVFPLLIHLIKAYQLTPYSEFNCTLTFEFMQKIPSTFLDLEDDSNMDLKSCSLKDIASKRPVLLISGYYTKKNPMLKKYRRNDPNIIIMTKDISPLMLYSPSVRKVLAFHRSLVVVLLTDKTRFQCENGSMTLDDLLSLQNFMNDLWHEYKIMRVIVIFPLSCKNKILIYDGKKKTNLPLYDRTTKLIDFNKTDRLRDTLRKSETLLTYDYPIKSHIFYRFPTAITNCRNLHYYTRVNLTLTEGYCGLDGLVMHDIIKYFKFNLIFPKDTRCYKYGYVVGNNITGSLGCIVRKQLDISFNSRFMTMYSSDYINFLHFIKIDSLCILVKRADIIPLWYYVVNVYENMLWALIISLLIGIGIILWLMAVLKYKINGVKRKSLFFYINEAFATTMLGFSLKRRAKWYLSRGTCLCSSIMFMAIYQGHINHSFTTLQRYKTITTLDSLYNSDKILYYSPSMKEIMRHLQNPEHKAQGDFLKRAQLTTESYLPEFILRDPRAALLGRKQDIMIEILGEYTDEFGIPLINIVDECLSTFYLSYVAQAGFLFSEELQQFLQRLREAGLPTMYYKWTCNMLRVPESLPKLRNEPRPFRKIQLADQRITFGLLIVGHLVSLFVFFIELLLNKRRTKLT